MVGVTDNGHCAGATSSMTNEMPAPPIHQSAEEPSRTPLTRPNSSFSMDFDVLSGQESTRFIEAPIDCGSSAYDSEADDDKSLPTCKRKRKKANSQAENGSAAGTRGLMPMNAEKQTNTETARSKMISRLVAGARSVAQKNRVSTVFPGHGELADHFRPCCNDTLKYSSGCARQPIQRRFIPVRQIHSLKSSCYSLLTSFQAL
jgi:hypothetical protein